MRGFRGGVREQTGAQAGHKRRVGVGGGVYEMGGGELKKGAGG